MNKPNKRDILVEMINYFSDGSQVGFCRKTGLDPTTVSRIVNGKMPLTDKTAIKIIAAIPEARAYLAGEASVPKEKTIVEVVAERDAEIARLREEIAIKNRTIDALLSKLGF